jgi:aspartyl-tRNA(Asn)/glutamyl-tRNA(Gln) amidotransferase subunit A
MPPLPTICEASRAIQRGELTPLDLVERCLQQIDRHESDIRAWVLVDADSARAQARRAGDEIAAGRSRGPLHGIPLGIKDIIDVEGWPTRCGSSIPPATAAAQDAALVARLRAAGAILLGKTVTTEWASFDPPPTRNPWNAERTPGGSSSGSAAAVASRMCLGAIGSQTGGSIVRPASYCGVAGLKPTYGRVSVRGVSPLAFHMDHPGPIARTAADLAMLLSAIAGEDRDDPLSAGAPAEVYAIGDSGAAPTLGLIAQDAFVRADAQVQDVVRNAIDSLSQHGALTRSVTLPESFVNLVGMHRRIMAVEAAHAHRHWFPDRRAEYGPKIASLLDEGLECPAIDYAMAVEHQARWRAKAEAELAGVDAWLMPATDTTAPRRDSTGNPQFQAIWSYAGLPVVSLPCALAEDGMPVAVQLIGRSFGEGALLRVAAWCERALGFDAAPPALES